MPDAPPSAEMAGGHVERHGECVSNAVSVCPVPPLPTRRVLHDAYVNVVKKVHCSRRTQPLYVHEGQALVNINNSQPPVMSKWVLNGFIEVHITK